MPCDCIDEELIKILKMLSELKREDLAEIDLSRSYDVQELQRIIEEALTKKNKNGNRG
ncbi:MAG: hypothetical protein ACP5LW_00625 [Nitrososphaeria archaeon]|jgi:hypothetical protein